MSNATIYFSDKSTLKVHEGDMLIPIVSHQTNDGIHASMGEPIELWDHTHNGLIPSLMDAFLKCDYFHLNHQNEVVYNSKAIVKIELT